MSVTIYVTDVYGNRIDDVTDYTVLDCALSQNDVGAWSLKFDNENFPRPLFFSGNSLALDRRIEVWRAPYGRDARLVFVGFLRSYEENAQGYAYTEDYTQEWTWCFAAGSGTEAARVLTYIGNDTRLVASPINRREGFYEDTNESDIAVLQSGAQGELYAHRPALNFAPRNIEIDYLYPHDWELGDMLKVSSGEPNTITVGGPDLTDILARRIVAYKTGTAEARKNAAADDMMKEYVYENMGAGATATRQLPAALGFEIAGDQTAAAALEYSAKFGNVLEVLRSISDRSAEAGERVYFGVVPVMRGGIVVPRLETRFGMWGSDKTTLPVSAGYRTQNLTIAGVRLTVSEGKEVVTPRFAEDNDA